MKKYLITSHATKEKIIVEANSAQEAARQVDCRIKEASPINIGQPQLNGMPISKAIEILDLSVKGCNPYLSDDTDNAKKLGIEAMLRIENCRKHPSAPVYSPLPGESEWRDS